MRGIPLVTRTCKRTTQRGTFGNEVEHARLREATIGIVVTVRFVGRHDRGNEMSMLGPEM